MKMRFGMIFSILATLASSSTVARADDKAVRKEIEAGYKKLIVAMKAKDINGVMKVGTDDFTYKQGKMTMTGAQMKQMMQQQFATMKSVQKMTMSIDKFNVKGDTAVVISSGSSVMTASMPDGKVHKMSDVSTSKDTWVKTPGGWKVKSVEILKDKMTMDGKPYDPMAAMAGGGAPPPPKKKK